MQVSRNVVELRFVKEAFTIRPRNPLTPLPLSPKGARGRELI